MVDEEDVLTPVILDALSIILCTDESKYTDSNSHYLHIPDYLFLKYINKLDLTNICFELSNSNDIIGPKIYLKKIEPSFNEFKKNILIPNWVQTKLNIQMMGGQLSLRPIYKSPKIKRCKIRGNNSSYIHMDIKKLLEDKINEFKCININTDFQINGIIFTFIELISFKEKNVNFGIITDELEIDFDTPDDIKLIEKRKSIIDKITLKIEDKINLINKQKSKLCKKKTGIFKFNDFINEKKEISNLHKQYINWNELLQDITNDLEKEFNNDITELEFNKKLLRELIEEAKNIQNKIINDDKKKLLDELNYNSTNSIKQKDNNNEIKTNIFNSKAYKLSNSTDDIKLSKDEIRKARLNKFFKD